MAEKKSRKKKSVKLDPQDQPEAQQILKSREEIGRELTNRAKTLIDPDKRNLLEVGEICSRFKSEEDLWSSQGYKGYTEWMQETFGKGVKTAQNSRKIYENVSPYLEKTQILGVGMVKAHSYSRLPESERAKDEWKDAVLHDDATTFKQKVTRFLKGAPDHRENFVKIVMDAPKSLKQVHDRVIEGYRNVLRADEGGQGFDEDWQVWEVIVTQLEQEHQDNVAWAHPEADAAAEKEREKSEEKAPSEELADAKEAGENAEAEQEEITGEAVACRVCSGEFPFQKEPANFVRGKARLLTKAPLKIRKELGTSAGHICGGCYFEMNAKPETADATE